MNLVPLTRAELPVETVALARFLIGAAIVHDMPEGRAVARIVETEAYVPGDAASHAFRGPTKRNRPMFGERGHAYVYLNYGVSWLFNVTSETPGVGAGVLVRAGEPLAGLDLMERRRGRGGVELGNGPGKLAQALGIGPAHDGLDLSRAGPLHLARPPRPATAIGVSTRIGLTKEIDRPLRFFEIGNPCLSGPRRLNVAAP